MHSRHAQRRLGLVLSLLLAALGCDAEDGNVGSDDASVGADGSRLVDGDGACGVICEGGALKCPVSGFDPAAGFVDCVVACQREWPNEKQCAGPAGWVLECVRANGSCDTLDDATCGDVPSGMLRDLLECVEAR